MFNIRGGRGVVCTRAFFYTSAFYKFCLCEHLIVLCIIGDIVKKSKGFIFVVWLLVILYRLYMMSFHEYILPMMRSIEMD